MEQSPVVVLFISSSSGVTKKGRAQCNFIDLDQAANCHEKNARANGGYEREPQ
jgi:hypothetical protein